MNLLSMEHEEAESWLPIIHLDDAERSKVVYGEALRTEELNRAISDVKR
jgi:hypothetical protein